MSGVDFCFGGGAAPMGVVPGGGFHAGTAGKLGNVSVECGGGVCGGGTGGGIG